MAFKKQLLLPTLSCFLLISGIESFGPVTVEVPEYAFQDNDAHLDCKYELGNETLYSVRWYKDGHEFLRYLPEDAPPVNVFELPGVVVDMSSLVLSKSSSFDLSKVSLSSSGTYMCEVTGEGPEFKTAEEEGVMVVAVLPEVGPKISGGKHRYRIGETLQVNCTSGSSSPPTQLEWLINGERVDTSLLRGPYTMGVYDVQKTVLGLEFEVAAEHFKYGDMKLKCLAWISNIYWQTYEESVKGEHQNLTGAISTEKTSNLTKSQAAEVQAKGEKRRSHVLLLVCTILAATVTNFFSSGIFL